MILENDDLSVELHGSLPVVKAYVHKSSGEEIGGDERATPLIINGAEVGWDTMSIELDQTATSASFRLKYGDISFSYSIRVENAELQISIAEIDGPLESIGFRGSTLLRVSDPEYRYARITTSEPDTMGKKWWREEFGRVGEGDSRCRVMHGCLYQPRKLCVFAHSNYPLLPEIHTGSKDAYEVALSDYRYAVRSRTMWPLRVKVVFLEDYNGDGEIDWSDFALWVNRTLPDADHLYRETISYKIFLTMRNEMVSTTYEQAIEIVRAIHNITDSIPQLVYLVGWQFQGHDDKYPSLSEFNPRPGGPILLRRLIDEGRDRYSTTISYHINIDDTYTDSPDWDPNYMGKNGVIHALDWESGNFTRRMNEMFELVPVEKTIHVDNTRICNNHNASFDDIGELEELFCGLAPMADWLKEKGLSVTTEGSNGIPIDGTLLFDGWFHYERGVMARQMLHRKIVGGGTGRHCGELTARDYALGSNIHVDFSYERRQAVVNYREDFRGMVDRIYLGSLLYLYFLQRELIVCRVDDDGRVHIEYDDGTNVDIVSDHSMTVTKGDMIIAKDNDTRCIPLNGELYIYAQIGNGEVMTFMLPPEWHGKSIKMIRLTRDGSEEDDSREGENEPLYKILDDRIEFRFMVPYQPYKAVLVDG